ncbi:tartronate-semialdehyde synthase [Streptomyces chrestomyceticus JCM 4735]|uniref:Tartronate-semialdehyde synthase n=1 Tax=Streptomyces chrestomyceticus JCM 4735 TaxID=1306181 RepID=A0A7U9KTR4_9ACTN|nr:thiamine pyrophosphate-binding protein [Streptomyces chrestomyceticus]GCD33906.1 tartronate-semialdehyde synthase [Streptomyces chrestomyceticus JCM 4735]
MPVQIFGTPGAAALPWYEALERADGTRHLMAHHEPDAVHMAAGWARTGGRTGVVVAAPEAGARSGAGLDGLLAGLRTAHADAVPLVCVTGRAAPPGRDGTAVPAVALVRSARPVTKAAVRVEDPARVPQALRAAFRTARAGRPGPVLIDLPYGTAAHDAVLGALDEQNCTRADDGRPHRASHRTRRFMVCGRGGPPGRQVPTAVGVRVALDASGHRDTTVVALAGADQLPYTVGAFGVAARYEVPFVLAVFDPGGRGGGRARELMRTYGCSGHRVDGRGSLRSALAWARKECVTTARPVLLLIAAHAPAEARAAAGTQTLAPPEA